MNPEEIPVYTIEDIERCANVILKEKIAPPITVPIDIELMLEQEPGVFLESSLRLKMEHGVAAVIVRDLKNDCYRVLVDAGIMNRPEALHFYRFTVAEELAHLRLHREVIDKVTTIEDSIEILTSEKYHQIDRNARRLAAALLMPSFLVSEDAREIYPGMVREVGYENPQSVKDYVVSQLSKRYQVSFGTMNYRLNEWPIRMKNRIDEAMRERLDFID